MYKKSLIIFIFIILLFISVCSSYSESENIIKVYLSFNKNVAKIGEEFTVSLNLENERTAAYNVNIYFDNNKLEFVSGPQNANVKDNRIIIVWYDKLGGNGAIEGILEKINFKAKEEGIATFEISGEFFNENGNKIETIFETTQIIIKKDNTILEESQNSSLALNKTTARLETLAIENTLLYPAFEKDILEYDAEVSEETTKINILAIPEKENEKVEIIGANNINFGKNKIIISVTSEDITSKTEYILNIYKRNKEEEEKYEESQNENNKKLKQAYETIKTSQTINNLEEKENSENIEKETENIEKPSNKRIIIFIIIVIIASIIIYLIVRKICRVHK